VRPRQADLDRYADDMRKLEQHLEQERSFLDPELTARRLAENLGVTENRLSAVLNDGMQTSFYDLVAGYRLAEFDRLARDADNRGRSVLELAYAAGFNSKASFYRLFRRSHGTTPTAFLKEVMP
jgi:AraC-like DNA-binding protein